MIHRLQHCRFRCHSAGLSMTVRRRRIISTHHRYAEQRLAYSALTAAENRQHTLLQAKLMLSLATVTKQKQKAEEKTNSLLKLQTRHVNCLFIISL